MKRKNIVAGISILGLLYSTNLWAHTSIAKKNTPQQYATASELEGSSGVINHFSISHGCAAPDSSTSHAVSAQAAVFPNGTGSIATKSGTGDPVALTDHINGNAIMGIKAVQDKNIFTSIRTLKGPVPAYRNHGLKKTDTRALHYSDGYLQTDLLGLVPFRASFPSFKSDSCATALTIRFAIANYCLSDRHNDARADIWIGHTTAAFNDPDVVSTGFWPRLKVLRDLQSNPLPAACNDGFEINVQPSPKAIDKYLPIPGYWPANTDDSDDD